LSGAAITPAGLKSLAGLPELRRLSLWNASGIDDTAAAQLEGLSKLRTLDLSNTAIGNETLSRLGKLTGLTRLYVNETKVTADAISAFEKEHPDVVVSSGERPPRRIPLSPGK
jgi:hypothetical protein